VPEYSNVARFHELAEARRADCTSVEAAAGWVLVILDNYLAALANSPAAISPRRGC